MPDADKLRSEQLPNAPHPRVFADAAGPILSRLDRELAGPSSLFHYTSAAGLLGIVSEHKLRFSNALFLNDGSETAHGVYMAAHAIDIFMADKSDDEKDLSNSLKEAIANAMYAYQPVVFCMSEENNLLNQWRDYGNDVTPYAIEFDRSVFYFNNTFNFEALLFKVIYDRHQQIALLLELATEIYNRASGIEDTSLDDNAKGILVRDAAEEFVRLIWRFKNQAFQSEREWRLMSTTTYLESRALPQFRTSSLGVVPYWERSVQGTDKRLPIKSVTVGPTPYGAASNLALGAFLKHHGYDVRTEYSTIPIRR